MSGVLSYSSPALLNQQFLLGLTWRHVSNRQPNRATVSERSGKHSPEAFTTVANELNFSMALASKESIGSASAAGLVAQLLESALVVCPVNDTGDWWFCAVRSGLVLEGSDRVVPRKEAARLFQQFFPVGTWKLIGDDIFFSEFAPDHDHQAQTLDSLLVATKGFQAPIERYGRFSKAHIAVGVSIVGVIGLSIAVAVSLKASPEEHTVVIASAPEMSSGTPPVAEKAPSKDEQRCSQLRALPDPHGWVKSIFNTTANLPVSIGGWNLTSLECHADLGSCTAKWSSTSATPSFDDLTAALSPLGEPTFSLSGKHTSLILDIASESSNYDCASIPKRNPFVANVIPGLAELRATRLVDWDLKEKDVDDGDIQLSTWSVNGTEWWTVRGATSRLPGLHFRIRSLSASLDTSTINWSMEGIYAYR